MQYNAICTPMNNVDLAVTSYSSCYGAHSGVGPSPPSLLYTQFYGTGIKNMADICGKVTRLLYKLLIILL